ncbi:FAD-dependent monooxygenase [Streptomyces sp. NPDC093225]|uniref:FAD-dependent monooxygenase n=1 Tax=Streptomyces sp. NPDC093225 TaxID=3366034 RepID=UPI00380855ED
MRAEVVVVGGGPVGLLIATELAAYGVDTVVLEAQGAVSERPKATTLHARAVQCLARRGRLPGAGGEGSVPAQERAAQDPGPVPAGAAPFHFAGVQGLVVTAPATEPVPILKCTQADLERHFERQALEAGARVLRGHRVTGLDEGPDAVVVTADGPEGPVRCTARYVVGADGARSLVRETAGIASDAYPATVSALAGRVRVLDPEAVRPGWHRTPRGWIVAKPAAGGAVHLRALDLTGPSADRRREPTLDEFEGTVSRIVGREVRLAEPRWLTRFSDFTRVVRTFRSGRFLLAGDAAHVHFPIGGQGLSTGVLDAVNLGWKLALTVRGEAGPGLLDSYDGERRPAALRVVDNTRAQLGLMRPAPEADAVTRVLGAVVAAQGEGGPLADMVSAQDTVYGRRGAGSAALEGTFLPNVVLRTGSGPADLIGLLAQGRPLLLVFSGAGGPASGTDHEEQARPWAGTVRVVHAEAPAEVTYGAVLVRPDGYVAWAGGGAARGAGPVPDPLVGALTAYFGERGADGR